MTTTVEKKRSRKPAAELADVQNSPDRRDIRIDKVGVKNIEYPIVVKDRANGTQSTVGTIDMYVDLPAQFKGTHMSRFLEVLNAHEGSIGVEELPDILDAAHNALQSCDTVLSLGTSAVVEPAASFIHLAKSAGATTIEINLQPTPISDMVDYSVLGKTGEILPQIVARLAS